MGKSAQTPETSNHEYSRDTFSVAEFLKYNLHTALPVRVKEVFPTPPGIPEKEKIGLVHVELGIQQMDNDKKIVETQPVYNLPYHRLQGGHCAVVIDPEPGDWGLAVFAERDISKWKRTKEKSLPDTFRTYSQSDGFYIGGFLNKKPKLYVQIHPDLGIIIESDTKNYKLHVGGNATILVDGDASTQVGGNAKIQVAGDSETNVNGKCNLNASGGCYINSGSSGAGTAASCTGKGNCCCAKSCDKNYKDGCCGAKGSNMCCNGSCAPTASTNCMKANPTVKCITLKELYNVQ